MRIDQITCVEAVRIGARLATGLCAAFCCALLLGCSEQANEASGGASAPVQEKSSAAVPATSPPTYAEIFADEAIWPVRLWLETPLVDEQGEVIVPERRLGVLMYLTEDGDARIDFGRFGPHTVPASQTNLADEALRVRAREAAKTFPNLVGLIAMRMLDPGSPALTQMTPPAELTNDDRVLLVFADPFTHDMPSIGRLVAELRDQPSLGLIVLFPLSSRPNGQIQAELRSKDWTDPFVLSALAVPYAAAMLEPGAEPPLLRLSSANGRILAQGAPSEETIARMRAVLMHAGG